MSLPACLKYSSGDQLFDVCVTLCDNSLCLQLVECDTVDTVCVSRGDSSRVTQSPHCVRSVVITRPRADECLGLSIRGGSECDLPIIISRVAQRLAVDHSTSRLLVGDTVLSVNGTRTSGLTHQQVVCLLRDAGHCIRLEVRYTPQLLRLSLNYALATSISPNLDAGEYLQQLGCQYTSCSRTAAAFDINSKHLIPLAFSHIVCDPNRGFTLHSVNLCDTYTFLCDRPGTQPQDIVATLYSVLSQIYTIGIAKTNELGYCTQGDVIHMGWVFLRERSEAAWSHKFVVLTDCSLLVYSTVPQSRPDWDSPVTTLDLLTTRLIHRQAADSPLTFVTRTGTSRGVRALAWRTCCAHDLVAWCDRVTCQQHRAVAAKGRCEFSCVTHSHGSCDSHSAVLCLDYARGIQLYACSAARGRQVFSHYGFERLVSVRDDERHGVCLYFNDNTFIRVEMKSSPKPFVFALHCFLVTKVQQIGLI